MDRQFVRHVPDVLSWGTHRKQSSINPRRHIKRKISITINTTDSRYQTIIQELALSIASARFNEEYLEIWKRAAFGHNACTAEEREILSLTLKRGISESGANCTSGPPPVNDSAFKGHVAEVLNYCIRVNLYRLGIAHPVIFEPPRPKEASNTPGIDLLEIGGRNDCYYFTVWECKGTDSEPGAKFYDASCQLVDDDKTAKNSFMESHRVLQENPLLEQNASLSAFVKEMPRAFYTNPPRKEKRLGGFVCSTVAPTNAAIERFPAKINDNAHIRRLNCQAISVHFDNFQQIRRDLYRVLWNIYWT